MIETWLQITCNGCGETEYAELPNCRTRGQHRDGGSRTCATCDRPWFEISKWHKIDGIGSVCETCLVRLQKPTVLDGCVAGPSLASLAESTHAEFERRRGKLIEQARELCKGA